MTRGGLPDRVEGVGGQTGRVAPLGDDAHLVVFIREQPSVVTSGQR